jgi:1,4-dihydroxy-2-naphthoyl-CoA hydrolase
VSVFTREELLASAARFSIQRDIRFQDVDAAGIVFFARFFDLFHDAYVAFLSARGAPLPDALASRRWAAPLVHAEADFLVPARFGDVVDVALVLGRLEGSRLSIGYRMSRQEMPCALGATVHVFVDPNSFRRVEPPPETASVFAPLL